MATEEEQSAEMILNTLGKHPKEIPLSLLYDKQGSEIYEEITRLPDYYLFNAEIKLFAENGLDIVRSILPGSLFVELGCGNASKTVFLLDAIQSYHGRHLAFTLASHRCRYVGIDVSESALKNAKTNLERLVPGLKPSAIDFVQADFLDGLKNVKRRYPDESLCIAWFGSSVGNLTHKKTVDFFKDVTVAAGSNCQLLVCMDMWKKPEILHSAYHDKQGVCERFAKNGLQNALSSIGYPPTREIVDSWTYEVQINMALTRVEMYVTFTESLNLEEHHIEIRPGEKVMVGFGTKYSVEDLRLIASRACLQVHASWGDHSFYTCQMLLPARQALLQCWNDTDTLFGGISDWTSKPIDLRHPFLFYYGHVCAFAKLKVLEHEKASDFDHIFSRGMDPNLLDPSQCHSHPPVPPEWPSKEAVIDYVKETKILLLKEGGYSDPHLWEEEDFEYFSKNGFTRPATWSMVGNEYYIHSSETTKHWTEVAEDAVYVSLAEAEAFCRWKECRIMTEAEYQRILDFDTQGMVQDIRGGGWEWTSTQFQPFPGFKPMPEYIEYSTDFFDGKHYVLKGWSHATHTSMRRDSFRNFYQRQYPFVFSKFRCCRTLT
eukprot:Gb_06303 [translate_table: standard]